MPRPRTKSDRWVGLPMLMSSSVPGSGQTRLDRQMGSSGSELERPAEALTACWLYHHRDVLRVLYAISLHQERVQQHDPLPRERIQSLSSLNLVRAYAPAPVQACIRSTQRFIILSQAHSGPHGTAGQLYNVLSGTWLPFGMRWRCPGR